MPKTDSTSANRHDSFPNASTSFVRVIDCVKFEIFPPKAEFSGVIVDKLTGAVIVNLGLFVGEGPFNLLWSELGGKRFVNLSLVIQLGLRTVN
jgi:hypothetical protein